MHGNANADGQALNLESQTLARKHPLGSIGLEIRVAFASLGFRDRDAADNTFFERKLTRLLVRPASEPIVLRYWRELKSFDIREDRISNLCSLLCASKQQARVHDSVGLWENCTVRFETANHARNWWADIRTVAEEPKFASLLPAYCFARTIIAHPYPDGNGRVARSLVHGALARNVEYSSPLLPLAPAFYMNGAKVAVALYQLSKSGDWEAFNVTFTHVLAHAAELARRVHAIS